jgi:hypothetical protein
MAIDLPYLPQKRLSLRPDDKPMTADGSRELHDRLPLPTTSKCKWLYCRRPSKGKVSRPGQRYSSQLHGSCADRMVVAGAA